MNSYSQRLSLNPVSLRFTGTASNLESRYIDFEYSKNLQHLRLVMILGVFFYSIYYLLDFYVAPEQTDIFGIIRLGIVSPYLFIMLGLTYLPIFKKIGNYIMISCVFVTSGGYVAMGILASGDMHIVYLIGVLVCLIFNFNLIRIPFIYAFVTGIIVSIIYSIIQIKLGNLSFAGELIYLISFLSVLPTLATISYTSERSNRRSYFLMNQLSQQHKEIEDINIQLTEAIAHVKQLGGLIPICAKCKNIRDDKGYWKQIEAYISEHSEAEFSHSICPDCANKLYPEYQNEA